MSPETALCTACGLCCDGTLFDFAKLEAGEEPELVAEGFRMRQMGEKRGFALGCHKLKDRRCTYYEARPAVCRMFRCTTLADLEAGRIAAEEAQRRVAMTRAAVDELTDMVPAGETLARLFGRFQAQEAIDPRVLLKAGVVNLLLDRHFRKDKQLVWDGSRPRQFNGT